MGSMVERRFNSRFMVGVRPRLRPARKILAIVSLVAVVGIGAPNPHPGHGRGLVERGLQGMAIIGVALEGAGGDEQTFPVGRRGPTLQPN